MNLKNLNKKVIISIKYSQIDWNDRDENKGDGKEWEEDWDEDFEDDFSKQLREELKDNQMIEE
jgi:hypothetical protein